MKKLFNLIKKLFKGGKSSTPISYNVTFETDWTCDWCSPMIDPVITNNSVTFNSGRVVSTHGYKNISKITATIDLSKMAPNSIQKNNWLNASFYMVNSSIKPKGTSYCDAGNNGSPYCNEIDFLETNGNKIFPKYPFAIIGLQLLNFCFQFPLAKGYFLLLCTYFWRLFYSFLFN